VGRVVTQPARQLPHVEPDPAALGPQGLQRALLASALSNPDDMALLAEQYPAEAVVATADGDHLVWRAMLAVHARGQLVEPLLVGEELRATAGLKLQTAARLLQHILEACPVADNVPAYLEVCLGAWRQRRQAHELELALARLKTGAAGPDWHEQLAATLAGTAAPAKGSNLRGVGDIFKPLQRIRWLCRALAIGPGRPTILSGYGGIGKTFAAQQLLLVIASGGTRIWDSFDIQHAAGGAVHLDYEQGQWMTDWRYQRLAWSMRLDPAQLEGRLHVEHFPSFYLTDPDAEKRLTALCTGRAVCLIDSLKAACKGVDENDSRMGEYLYLLARVSERTGCIVIVIHHEGKSGGENPRQGIERLRGSSAIAAGAGAVVSFVKDGTSGCIRIEHVRANLGAAAEPVVVRLTDEGELDPVTEKSEGIRLEFMPAEQLRAEASSVSDEQQESELLELSDRMFACVERHQNRGEGVSGAGTVSRLLALKVRRQEAYAAWDHLKQSGRITSNGKRGVAARWHITTQADSEPTNEE
jgi:hypothetical protein